MSSKNLDLSALSQSAERWMADTGLCLGYAEYREPFTRRKYIQLMGDLGSHKLYSWNAWDRVVAEWRG